MPVSKNIQLFLCLLGGHAAGLFIFSYGVLQVYMYSYMYEYDSTLTMNKMHMHIPICLMVGSGMGWLQGLSKYVGPSVLHFFNMALMCGCCLLMYWFCYSYMAVTISMVGIGLSYGMLHVYFISTAVNRVEG